MSPEGERKFISEWKSFEYPRQWSKLPNPISHTESFMMSDRLRLEMVIPFILYRFLTASCLKSQEMEKLQIRANLNRNQVNRPLAINCLKPRELAKIQGRTNLYHSQVVNAIIKCWAVLARCFQLAFKISLTKDDYVDLEKYLKKERKALIDVSLLYALVVQEYYVC